MSFARPMNWDRADHGSLSLVCCTQNRDGIHLHLIKEADGTYSWWNVREDREATEEEAIEEEWLVEEARAGRLY